MILGLIAGAGCARRSANSPEETPGAGVVGIAAASSSLHAYLPVVKRIWTPSWTLFSGGVAFLFLAAFCWVIEVKQRKGWAFPWCHRHEFHRCLLYRALHEEFLIVPFTPTRSALLPVPRNRPRTVYGRRRRAALLLGGVVLDVPQETVLKI